MRWQEWWCCNAPQIYLTVWLYSTGLTILTEKSGITDRDLKNYGNVVENVELFCTMILARNFGNYSGKLFSNSLTGGRESEWSSVFRERQRCFVCLWICTRVLSDSGKRTTKSYNMLLLQLWNARLQPCSSLLSSGPEPEPKAFPQPVDSTQNEG